MSDTEDTDVHGGEAGGAEDANDTVANPVAQTDDGQGVSLRGLSQ